MLPDRKEMNEEIRINPKYTNLYQSEYNPSLLNEDSTPIIHKKSLLTMDYLRRISVSMGERRLNVLPPNCRYIEKVKGGNIVIIEEPPAFRTISINLDFRNEVSKLKREGKLEEYGYNEKFASASRNMFNLAFPYVVFIFYINDFFELQCGQAYLRVARMAGLSDYLLKMPMLNISDSQYICFGSGIRGSEQSLNAAIEKTISVFWNAEFNNDYMYNYNAYERVPGISTYMEWQALSASNPMFIYNVDWIKIPMNVGEAIDEIKRHYHKTGDNGVEYRTLSQIFNSPLETGKTIHPSKRSRKKYSLFYDVAEGTFLDDRYYVHVGDPFLIKHGKNMCHINSLISFKDSGDIKYFRVEREDGRLIMYKNTSEFSKFLKDKTIELRYEKEGTLKNGVVVKKDDIIRMKNYAGDTIYKKIGFIRASKQGYHECRFGDGFYILENTEGEVYDIETPELYGIKLEKNKPYLYINNIGTGVPLLKGHIVTFNNIDTDSRGKLYIEFDHIDRVLKGSPFKINLNIPINDVKVMEIESARSLPPLFRVGRRLLVARKNSKMLMDGTVFGTQYGVAYENGYHSAQRPSSDEIKKYLLNDNKFIVKSYDMDIEFTIGDKVVSADWDNPINMLSVKIIQGFVFDESSGDISFALADKDKNLHTVKYVEGSTGTIFTGRIRHITNAYGKLTAGTKIQAQEAGIAHFLKKDTNIIIGFITDTDGPEPLVLCSNCCTQWYSDVINKFKKITMKNKKWASIPHAPIDVAKIKYQPGDIINGSNEYISQNGGWIIFKVNGINTLKILDFRHYTSYPEYYTLDKYIEANTKFDCILNPRVSPKLQNEVGTTSGWPNLHGLSYKCDAAKFEFINDERSIIDVQSSIE